MTAKVTEKGEQTNNAVVSITSGATDPVSDNNTAGAKVTGSNGSDLSLSKTASNYQNGINVAVPIDETYQYTLEVTNNGPLAIPAAGGNNPPVVITETLPAGVTVDSIDVANEWTCTGLPATGATTFTCTHNGGFTRGQTRSLILNAMRTTEGNATNRACVAFGDPEGGGTPTREDGNKNNNCDDVAVGASAAGVDPNDGTQADLEITKTASGDVYAGENLTYTFVIKNNGPKDSENVVLYDQLGSLDPSGESLVSITGLESGQTCTPTAGAKGTSHTLNCQLGTLTNGAKQTISVTVRPNVAEVGEDRGNTAFIYSNTTYATNMVMTDVFPGTLNIGGIEYPSTAVFEYLGITSVTSQVGTTGPLNDWTSQKDDLCEQPAEGALADPAAATPLQLECSFPLVAPDEVITINFKMRAHSLPDGRSTGTIFHNATVKVDEKERKAGLANPRGEREKGGCQRAELLCNSVFQRGV